MKILFIGPALFPKRRVRISIQATLQRAVPLESDMPHSASPADLLFVSWNCTPSGQFQVEASLTLIKEMCREIFSKISGCDSRMQTAMLATMMQKKEPD